MKQVLQNLKTGQTTIAEVPVPAVQPGQALIKNAASLVSAGTERMIVEFAGKSLPGKALERPDLVRQVLDKARREGVLSTLEAALNRLDQPLPLGYSSAGTIVALGEGLAGFRVGQRVACAGGGHAVHAEYISVPGNLIAPLPAEVDFESAAFTTLGAIALHGFRLAEGGIGDRVAVIGLGLLGLLAASIARAAGCHVLGIDLDPSRVSLAEDIGLDSVLREGAEEAASGFTHGQGFDALLICADTPSADPVQLAGEISRDRARVIAVGAVGLELPRKIYYEKELTFINSRSYGPGRYDPGYEEQGRDYPIGYVRWTEGRNLEAFVELLARKRLDVSRLITHRFPIEQAEEAYRLITQQSSGAYLGVILTYPDERGEEMLPIESRVLPARAAEKMPVPGQASAGSVRLGVLGAGNFAQAVMLPAIQKVPGIEFVGIASASGSSAQHAANRYKFGYASSDEAQVLSDERINTVAILTRHNLHARQAITALQAGKHVFCEKPLAIREEDIEQILEALSGSGEDEEKPIDQILTVGFNRRFAPLTLRLEEFLSGRKEPLIAYYRVNAGRLPLTHWTQDPNQGGGRIIGEACHFIDMLTHLVGVPPQTVSAQGLPDNDQYREDNVVITLGFPDGSLGIVSYLANGDRTVSKEYLEVFCGGSVAVLDDFRTLETVRDGKRQTYRSRLRQDKGHRGIWMAFSQAVQAGAPPPIPYTQIFGVARASICAVSALRNGIRIEL
jgi:predicted dehydrogenase/threonine dehydrogenase-like Zn-dependent dehydrogenase